MCLRGTRQAHLISSSVRVQLAIACTDITTSSQLLTQVLNKEVIQSLLSLIPLCMNAVPISVSLFKRDEFFVQFSNVFFFCCIFQCEFVNYSGSVEFFRTFLKSDGREGKGGKGREGKRREGRWRRSEGREGGWRGGREGEEKGWGRNGMGGDIDVVKGWIGELGRES